MSCDPGPKMAINVAIAAFAACTSDLAASSGWQMSSVQPRWRRASPDLLHDATDINRAKCQCHPNPQAHDSDVRHCRPPNAVFHWRQLNSLLQINWARVREFLRTHLRKPPPRKPPPPRLRPPPPQPPPPPRRPAARAGRPVVPATAAETTRAAGAIAKPLKVSSHGRCHSVPSTRASSSCYGLR